MARKKYLNKLDVFLEQCHEKGLTYAQVQVMETKGQAKMYGDILRISDSKGQEIKPKGE